MITRNMSVVKVYNVLLVTVPPEPDDETVHKLQQEILKAMEKYEPKGLILDISTVEILDSFFARTIAETGEMVALMGGQTIIAGMNASVAITVTQLGLTLGNTKSSLTVDQALDMLSDSRLGRLK